MTKNIYGMASDHAQAVIDTAIVVWMQIQTSPRNTKFDIFFGLSTFGNPYFGADGIGVLGVLLFARRNGALCRCSKYNLAEGDNPGSRARRQ